MEHYGFELSPEVIRKITLSRAESMSEELLCPNTTKQSKQLLAESDGSMVPIVETQSLEGESDRRKVRNLSWRECRLCFAREIDSLNAFFQATIGSSELVCDLWKSCAVAAGFTDDTAVHCIGDGALWVREQAELAFGTQADYLVDFYHLSEYLAAAAPIFNESNPNDWRHIQQKRLKEGNLYLVLQELGNHLYPIKVSEETESKAVRDCYRYLTNRLDQLDYLGAILEGLPIGSGEIESSHRMVVQKRLKKPGGWWKLENAEAMLNLLSLRANNRWEAYWETSDCLMEQSAA